MASNYKTLDRQIEQLVILFRSAKTGEERWSEVWSLKRQIYTDFREVKYPTGQERSQAWQRYREIVDEIQQQRDEADRLRAERKAFSSARLNEIETLINKALNYDPFAMEFGVFVIGFALIPNLISAATTGDDLFSKQLDILRTRSSYLRDARELFEQSKNILERDDKNEAFTKLKNAQILLKEAWSAYNGERQKHHEAKQSSWRQRTEEKLNNAVERASRLRKRRDNQEAFLDKCKVNRDSARSEQFRVQMQSKIDSVKGEISDLNRDISSNDEYIREFREKLRK